mgnify:CR=1 FL=1|eukprot:scaffold235557_cov25-Tisochrysis_lutea.AAC.3
MATFQCAVSALPIPAGAHCRVSPRCCPAPLAHPRRASARSLSQVCRSVCDPLPQQFKYTEPRKCKNASCPNTSEWILLTGPSESRFVDWQRVRVQVHTGPPVVRPTPPLPLRWPAVLPHAPPSPHSRRTRPRSRLAQCRARSMWSSVARPWSAPRRATRLFSPVSRRDSLRTWRGRTASRSCDDPLIPARPCRHARRCAGRRAAQCPRGESAGCLQGGLAQPHRRRDGAEGAG